MGYAVFHPSKGKGNGNKLGAHIDRDDSQSQTFRSADPERRHLNRNVKLPNGYSGMKLEDAINARISEGYRGKRSVRKDAVKFISMVMTGSHREMKEIFSDGKKSRQWLTANLDFACREFGRDNIVRATLHLDEKTPHLHIVAVPLTKDGRLSAKEIFGDVRKLSERQDRYADAMRPFGLERGIKGAKSVHTSEGWYIARQKEADKAISSPLEQLSFLERLNPYKKTKVLSEGLKLARSHRFDSDRMAEREHSKVLELSERNGKLEAKIDRLLGNEAEYLRERAEKTERLKASVLSEAKRLIDGISSPNRPSNPHLADTVSKIVFEASKRQKGMSQELYEKIVRSDGFLEVLLDRAFARACQFQKTEPNRTQKPKR